MAGRFKWKKFSECNINDPFFDSLKEDYIEFPVWFAKKSLAEGERALVCQDEKDQINAFVYLKPEAEEIELVDRILPAISRLKIGTMKLGEEKRGVRLGEGVLGVALWHWQDLKVQEIYVTVYAKHKELILLLDKFGFECYGEKKNGEKVYAKNRKNVDVTDPYKSFPFISGDFERAGILAIRGDFHDLIFPYSELRGVKQNFEEVVAGNGITKAYIAFPQGEVSYREGCPVFIYRQAKDGEGTKRYKSCITSVGTVTKISVIKNRGVALESLEDFVRQAGNKTIFKESELEDWHKNKKNLVVIELVYNKAFGAGNNINYDALEKNGFFSQYPYQIIYTRENFMKILEMGDQDVQNIIVD